MGQTQIGSFQMAPDGDAPVLPPSSLPPPLYLTESSPCASQMAPEDGGIPPPRDGTLIPTSRTGKSKGPPFAVKA
eukprot:8551556-Pyramimonas_sp.AAC.1